MNLEWPIPTHSLLLQPRMAPEQYSSCLELLQHLAESDAFTVACQLGRRRPGLTHLFLFLFPTTAPYRREITCTFFSSLKRKSSLRARNCSLGLQSLLLNVNVEHFLNVQRTLVKQKLLGLGPAWNCRSLPVSGKTSDGPVDWCRTGPVHTAKKLEEVTGR